MKNSLKNFSNVNNCLQDRLTNKQLKCKQIDLFIIVFNSVQIFYPRVDSTLEVPEHLLERLIMNNPKIESFLTRKKSEILPPPLCFVIKVEAAKICCEIWLLNAKGWVPAGICSMTRAVWTPQWCHQRFGGGLSSVLPFEWHSRPVNFKKS